MGSRQSGPIGEVNTSNDPVIAKIYTDYKVPGAYSESNSEKEYEFGLFDENRCSI